MKKIQFYLMALLVIVSCSDDDDVITVPQCETPINVQVVSTGIEDATLTWENNNVDAEYTIEYGISGFTQGNGTFATSSTNSYTITGLTANTTYQAYITTLCSSTNQSMPSDALTFTTNPPRVVPEFLPNLSQLHIYNGALNDLQPSIYAFKYELNSSLFSDYAYKERLIALPEGESMAYVNATELPDFPDNTLIAKTFFYYNNEGDPSQGKKIIETRILIKQNGVWEFGDYHWNNEQTDAVLNNDGAIVPVTYIDADGGTRNLDYKIPNNNDCFSCHNNAQVRTPIGPKIRSINFNNQLENLIANNQLTGSPNPNTLPTLPNWKDTSYTLEERARAYFEINCAHCHIDDGYCGVQSELRLSYETSLTDSKIVERSSSIDFRLKTYNEGVSMPLIGTTMQHPEGYALIKEYLTSL
ncbi:fibronectin type III domain-containing protein [Lacinutrix salivirga]